MNEDDFVVDAEAEENQKRQADVDSDAGNDNAVSKVVQLKKELESTRKEKQEYMDGWQRSKADYVNALRRFEEEKKSAKQAGTTAAVEVLLPAFDAIERAKEHGEIPEGFAGIVKQLEGAFTSLGLVPVGEVGESFNPLFHEAFGQDVTDDKARDDTVTAVLERGWKQGESIIRPAKVKVAHYAN